MTTPKQRGAQNRNEPQLVAADGYIVRGFRRLAEALGPYAWKKTEHPGLLLGEDITHDVQKILNVMTYDNVLPKLALDPKAQSLLRKLRYFRNELWAHLRGYNDYEAQNYLNDMSLLLSAVSAEAQAQEVAQMRDELSHLIVGLTAPVRQQPPSEYAELRQQIADLRNQLSVSQQMSSLPSDVLQSIGLQMLGMSAVNQPAAPEPNPLLRPTPVAETIPPVAETTPPAAGPGISTPADQHIGQPDHFMAQGMAALEAGDHTHAIECLNRAVELDPSLAADLNINIARAYYHRGNDHRNKGEYDQAIADYGKADEFNPCDLVTFLERDQASKDRAELHFDMTRAKNDAYEDKYDQAIADCSKALELEPGNADAYINRGIAYTDKGKYVPEDEGSGGRRGGFFGLPEEYIAESNANFDKAIADFDQALKINPDNADVYIYRGIAYAGKREYAGEGIYRDIPIADHDKAIADFGKALKIDSDNAEAYFQRGVFYRYNAMRRETMVDYDQAIADYGQAIADCGQALKLNPDNAEARSSLHFAYVRRGLVYYYKGEFDQAIASFSEAIEFSPKSADFYVHRGRVYYHKGEYDQAIADFDKALKLEPNDPYQGPVDPYTFRGGAYFHKGDYDQAIADFDKALELDSWKFGNSAAEVDFYEVRGRAYLHKGEYDQAIANFDDALKSRHNNPGYYVLRGLAYFYKGEYEQAIADYDKVLELNPGATGAYYLRGIVYADKGEYDRAIADFGEVLERNSSHTDAYFDRGNAYANKGEYDRAISDYGKALGLDPDNAAARENLELATQLRDAVTEYDQATRDNPDDPDVWHVRGLHYLDDRQDYDRALADFNQAISLAPDRAEIRYDRGRVHYALGDYLSAYADYSRAIDLNPNDHIAWCERGRAHQRRGEHHNAISDFDQSLTRNPNYAPAYQLRSLSHAAIGNREQAQTDYEMGLGLASAS